MDRRQFLRSLAIGAAGLYVPTKTIFLPPKGGWPVSQESRPRVIIPNAVIDEVSRLHQRQMDMVLFGTAIVDTNGQRIDPREVLSDLVYA